MVDIKQIYDKLFRKTFNNPKNARDFLKRALPKEIKKRLDFSTIEIEPTSYVSDEFQDGYSDIVVKAKLKGKDGQGKDIVADIYFILEHKTETRVKIFIQILKYMCFVWEQDLNDGKPLRPIIPIIFYHGKEKWNVPKTFVDQFDVDDEVKQFMLNFRYVMFDTNEWEVGDESNNELKENAFLFTAMAVMKAAFKNSIQTINELFHFWHEKDFTKDRDSVLLFLKYISQTHEMSNNQLKEMLDNNKIDGGDIMETMAERWQKEGRLEGERKGKREGKRETVLAFLKNGVDINTVIKATGFTREEVEKMAQTVH